jgi:hypothetical protein
MELDPSVQGTHLKHWTLRSMVRTDFARRGLPWARLLLAGEAPSRGLNLSLRHAAGAVASAALLVALAARRPRAALAPAGVLVAVNWRLYLLVGRRRGPLAALLAPCLHVLHHLVGAAAAGAGLAITARARAHSRPRTVHRPARGGSSEGPRPA